MQSSSPPRERVEALQWLALLALSVISLVAFASANRLWHPRPVGWQAIFWTKTLIEVLASFYALFYLVVALTYRTPRPAPARGAGAGSHPRLAVAYLCCDDFDVEALESIARFCGGRAVPIFVHDDSADPACRAAVDRETRELARRCDRDISVLRRLRRGGGKPQAVNNLVAQLPRDIEYLLLCDCDSYFYDGDAVWRGLEYFDADDVAVVQFRNIGHSDTVDTRWLRSLAESVTFYDAFVYCLGRFGWTPFLGHNALLRLSVYREIGGLTAGQLADDIDYSVRLRLAGYRIGYARDVVAGERHPISYEALRKRTLKWTYGCTQILVRLGLQVLLAPSLRLRAAEKVSFFLTVSYYHFQLVLLGYLVIFYLVLPFSDEHHRAIISLLLSAGMILFLTFVPSVSYFARSRRLESWPRTAFWWSMTYGSQDFVMLSAVYRHAVGKPVSWVPTNAVTGRSGAPRYRVELAFGLTILAVASIRAPELLLLPTTALFAGKFLMAPVLSRRSWQRNHPPQAAVEMPGEMTRAGRRQVLAGDERR